MKNYNLKRILSLALALVLTLSVLPAPKAAAEGYATAAKVTCPACQ